jgi:hypothetical protein
VRSTVTPKKVARYGGELRLKAFAGELALGKFWRYLIRI